MVAYCSFFHLSTAFRVEQRIAYSSACQQLSWFALHFAQRMAAYFSFIRLPTAVPSVYTPYCSEDGSGLLIFPLINSYHGLRAGLLCGWLRIAHSSARQWLFRRFAHHIAQWMTSYCSHLHSSTAFMMVCTVYCSVDSVRVLTPTLVNSFHDSKHTVLLSDASGKKICVRTHWLRPDVPGTRDALDAPWQGTYHFQRETQWQCEFGCSTPWHRAFGCRMPGRRASGHSSPGICLLDGVCQGIFLLDAAVSGHFPSGRSCVRAFSFWVQQCQGKWHPDNACHGTMVTLSVKVLNIVANTLVTFANTQWVPGIVTQSSSIHSI